MTTQIRRASSGDAPTILRFIRELAEFERAPEKVETDAATIARQLEMPSPPFLCWLAFVEEEPAGFALAFHTYSTWKGRTGMWLEDLYVSPTRRGEGLGMALLRTVAQEALAEGCGRLELTVLEWNTGAQEVYRAAGLAPLTEWRTWRAEGQAIADIANG